MKLDKPKKSNKIIILMCTIVVFLLLIVGVMLLIIYNYSTNNQDKKTIQNYTNNSNSKEWGHPSRSSSGGHVDPAKPIIYLYPEETLDVEVKLGNPEYLSCTYPIYEDGWKVIANPDGNLIDKKTGRNLYALYWEGENIPKQINMQEGFCIKGEDTSKFLEEKLELLGLNEKEAEEFIIYWLPKMQNNKYNFIRFETIEEQNSSMPLEVTPKPDSVIRIMMDWKALDEKIEVSEQKLVTPEREGFTLVEWGGSELK